MYGFPLYTVHFSTLRRLISQRKAHLSFKNQHFRHPQNFAQSLKHNGKTMNMQTRSSSSSTSTVLIVVLVLLTFPLWIGLIGGLFGLIAGVFGAVFGIIGGVFGAIFGAIAGIFGWMFHWGGPWNFHMGFWSVKVLSIIAVIVIVVMLTRPRR
jgi:hypothetical protein